MALRARDMAALEAKHARKPKPKADKVELPPEGSTLYVLSNQLPILKPRRLTRQERAKVRQFVRDSRKRNGRSRREFREVKKRNAAKLAEDGDRALVFYLQDVGAGVISVTQILREVA